MRRALITGLSGFTGKFLAAELNAAGYEVFGTTLGSGSSDENMHQVDLCDLKKLRDVVTEISPDVVAHLAAVSFVGHENVDEIYQTNIMGTRNLLQALSELEKLPSAVLLASSANIYGNSSDDPISENSLALPMNDYAVSKLAMEKMAALWFDILPIFVVRPFNYIGVGQSPNFLVPKIIKHFCENAKEIELGNIDVSRDFSDVRMVAKSYQKLLELAPAGKVFNICSGKSISLREIINMMAEIAGYEIELKINPAFIRKNEIKNLRGSNQNLTNLIGATHHIPIKETLQWMYQESKK